MIILPATKIASSTEPLFIGIINSAFDWISALLFGPLATIFTSIAVAWLGFNMLSGRIDVRRGIFVLLGCFLLFGAKEIVVGLRSAAAGEYAINNRAASPPSAFADTPEQSNVNNGYDPYADTTAQNSKD